MKLTISSREHKNKISKSNSHYLTFFFVLLFGANIFCKQIPFNYKQNLIFIDVLINDTLNAKFILDNGADKIYLDNSFITDNKLVLKPSYGQRDILSIESLQKPSTLELSRMVIGSDTLSNLTAYNLSLDMVIVDSSMDLPDGLLGYEYFKGNMLTVDYNSMTIEIGNEVPSWLEEDNFIIIPFRMYKHFVLLDLVIADSLNATMILDNGATHTIFDIEFAKKNEAIFGDNTKKGSLKSIEIKDRFFVRNFEYYINDLSLLNSSSPRLKVDGIIGNSFLENFIYTIDYKNKRVLFSKNN